MNQNIRIIGGRHRGKKLIFPNLTHLRPTPNRVRETLFNWLMHDIQGARCLDAFAGSGALSFEAYSRGAARVVLLEYAEEAYLCLKKNLHAFHASQQAFSLLRCDAIDYLTHATEQFDIIFLDPPFSQNLLPICIEKIQNNALLADQGLLYIETDEKIQLDESRWQSLKLKQAGQVIYGLYKKKSLLPHSI